MRAFASEQAYRCFGEYVAAAESYRDALQTTRALADGWTPDQAAAKPKQPSPHGVRTYYRKAATPNDKWELDHSVGRLVDALRRDLQGVIQDDLPGNEHEA